MPWPAWFSQDVKLQASCFHSDDHSDSSDQKARIGQRQILSRFWVAPLDILARERVMRPSNVTSVKFARSTKIGQPNRLVCAVHLHSPRRATSKKKLYGCRRIYASQRI